MKKKVIYLKRWRVQVLDVDLLPVTISQLLATKDYTVIAVNAMDARIIAFALDGGFSKFKTHMTDGDIELVKTYTKII